MFQLQAARRELKHLQEVLAKCKYLKWAIDKVLQMQEDRRIENRRDQGKNTTTQAGMKGHIVVPYSEGLCETYKTIKYSVQVHFKGGNTLKNLLMFPKDKEAITRSKIIYWYKCGKTACDDEYIGRSSRTFEEQYKEHLKALSLIFEEQNITGQTTTVGNFKIISREGQNMTRAIKEAGQIRVNKPTLNRNVGKYNLPHTGDKVLFSISELKTK